MEQHKEVCYSNDVYGVYYQLRERPAIKSQERNQEKSRKISSMNMARLDGNFFGHDTFGKAPYHIFLKRINLSSLIVRKVIRLVNVRIKYRILQTASLASFTKRCTTW